MTKSFLSEKEKALKKLQRYCAYQDRCHQEVHSKLLDLKIYGADLEEIIVHLIEDNFLNEERFACSYARGKFRIKKWGRNKIIPALKKRAISPYCIRKAMKEIEEEEYIATLKEVLEKKRKTLKEKNDFILKSKLAQYAISRGFESHLIWELLNNSN